LHCSSKEFNFKMHNSFNYEDQKFSFNSRLQFKNTKLPFFNNFNIVLNEATIHKTTMWMKEANKKKLESIKNYFSPSIQLNKDEKYNNDNLKNISESLYPILLRKFFK